MIKPENYKTIKQIAEIYYPLFTEKNLRQLIFKNTDNIQSAVFKLGGKTLINVEKFELWFKSREEDDYCK